MIFKKGDRVKFLNDIGGGIVTRTDQKTVYVQNEDGFEVPALAGQLLKIEVSQEELTPFTVASPGKTPENDSGKTVTPGPEQASGHMDLSSDPETSDTDTSVNILLAWTATKNKGKYIYDLYLVNDCSYHIMYVTAMITEGVYKGIQAGMLENDSSIHLTEVKAEDLKDIDSIRLEILFFKKGAFMPQEPIRYELKIDEFHLMDTSVYVPNIYFEEKTLIFNVSEEFLLCEIENVAREIQAELEKQKRQADQPAGKPVVKKKNEEPVEEVDLHINQLIDHAKDLSPAEILDIQMGHFSIALEGAIRNRQKRIIFIHGVGNGRLRHEIHSTLDRKYPKLRYQDASFKEYGYGATLVFL